MPEALDKARSAIEGQIHDLEAQVKKLRDVLTRLGHGDGQEPARKPARRTTRRAPRGQRERQLLASIEKHPDYKPSEHAKAMKVTPNQVYAVARRLQAEGKITKTARGTYATAKPRRKAKAS